MTELFRLNQPETFWGQPTVPAAAREAAVAHFLESLAIRPTERLLGDWSALMELVLGEGQFGSRRYELGASKRLYYRLRPFLPRVATAFARRRYHAAGRHNFRLDWPAEDRFVRLLGELRAPTADRSGAGPRPWPGGADFAFVLTHDVEGERGQAFVPTLAEVDARYGFRSSFNFVPERYRVDGALLGELAGRGFEVGVHGLRHDGRLFFARAEFDRRARRINAYLREWEAVGFRSPLTHRNPEWMQALEIEYDLSFFDTDPFEPMPGGTMSIWPFFCGRFVELPYTLAQDHTLLVVLGERTPRLWIEKVEFLAARGGMALVNAHPDYLRDRRSLAIYEEFLQDLRRRVRAGTCWHALPREVARWWRERHELIRRASARATGESDEVAAGAASGAPIGSDRLEPGSARGTSS